MVKGTGLTEAQVEMLRDAAGRPQRVVRGYKPAEELAALGLVEIAISDAPCPWIVWTTTAGRAALAERGEAE